MSHNEWLQVGAFICGAMAGGFAIGLNVWSFSQEKFSIKEGEYLDELEAAQYTIERMAAAQDAVWADSFYSLPPSNYHADAIREMH